MKRREFLAMALGAALVIPAVKTVSQIVSDEDWFESHLQPKLKKICENYKKASPKTREKMVKFWNKAVDEHTEPDDFVRNAMYSFRDNLIETYG